MLDRLAGLPADAPDVPGAYGHVGELSYWLYVNGEDPRDLALAGEMFVGAFRRPGFADEWHAWRIMFAHVRAYEYDRVGSAELREEIWQLAGAGMAGLPADDAEYDVIRNVGTSLLAATAKARYMERRADLDAESVAELLDEAIRCCEAAAARMTPGSAEEVDLRTGLGFLYLMRCEGHGTVADAVTAAGHYRAVLDAALPDSDLPNVRYGRGLALMTHGRAVADRDELDAARAEFETAVAQGQAQARADGGEVPAWVLMAQVRIAFVRTLIWTHWRDQAQAAAAEVELRELLAKPGVEQMLLPPFLDMFGRVLFERAGVRGDDALRERSIDLLRRAVTEWQTERDGGIGPTVFFFASYQLAQYMRDKRPDRLKDLLQAALLLLTEAEGGAFGERSPDLSRMARAWAGWARFTLDELGLLDVDDATRARLDAIPMSDTYEDMLNSLAEGAQFIDFSLGAEDEEFPGTFGQMPTMDQLSARFDTVYEKWRGTEVGSSERARGAAMILQSLPIIDPHGNRVTRAQRDELREAVLQGDPDDPDWQTTAHGVLGAAGLADELAGDGRGMDEVIDHLDRAGRKTPPGRTGRATGRQDTGTGQGGAGTPKPGTPKPGGRPGADDRELNLDFVRMMARHFRGQTGGGADDMEEAGKAWQKLRDNPTVSPHLRLLMDGQQAAFDASAAVRRGDVQAADRCIAVIMKTHTALDPEHSERIQIWTLAELSRAERNNLAEQLGLPPAPRLPGRLGAAGLRRAARRLPRDHHAWVLGDNGLLRFAEAFPAQDGPGIAEALELLQEAYDMVDDGSDSKLRYGNTLGIGHCVLAVLQALPHLRDQHLNRGITLLEQALRDARGPEHRLYANTGLALGRAYRTRGSRAKGDLAKGRRTGLDALRGHSWAALLQAGTVHAAQAAASATSAALEVAAWGLKDGVPEDAVRALDACRGLVLHAATTSRTVPDRLVAAGHADLAAEWRSVGADADTDNPIGAAQGPVTVPSSLRRRVFAALTAPGDGGDSAHEGVPGSAPASAQDRLLAPPEPHEIGLALRAVGKDALVYLVPASEDGGGAAVLVTSRGETHAVPLPRLTEDAAPLREYLAEGTPGDRRDLGPVPGHPGQGQQQNPEGPQGRAALRRRLDRLCGWAWYAGMRPLLETIGPSGRPGRVPRLVLVPMGDLGLVPWHAAFEQGDDGRRRYALQAAEISYAASARLLCDVAARPAVEHTGSALVVGNPTGDLYFAGEEADAVQGAFYPRGQFLGRRTGTGRGTANGTAGSAANGTADGAGTPQEVLAWLRKGGRDEGGVLHLACHASVARSARRSAFLSLSGGELSAEELTEAVSDGGRGRLGLVLLAACRSHVSGHGNNEAYSLSTAFLVAGARSVIGSLWPVPDDATSVLMFLTHHFLRIEGEPPAKALRRAQLWMLKPGRELPPGFPPFLAHRARGVDADDLSAWAGFTHLGQ